ncbi:hypothetical protein WN943_014826 [Citrus x changshan-huyou]
MFHHNQSLLRKRQQSLLFSDSLKVLLFLYFVLICWIVCLYPFPHYNCFRACNLCFMLLIAITKSCTHLSIHF